MPLFCDLKMSDLAVYDLLKMRQPGAKKQADSLVTQADTENRFLFIIVFKDTFHHRKFIRQTRARGKDDLIVYFNIRHCKIFRQDDIKCNFAVLSQ